MKKELLSEISSLKLKLESCEAYLTNESKRNIELNRDKTYLEKELKQLYETFKLISSITKDETIEALCETRKNDIKNFIYIREEGEE